MMQLFLIASIEAGGQDVGQQLVAAGLAWHYTRYSDDAGLAAAEREARAARRGLWADREPVLPWEWRASEQRR
jgi:micrococcal nuclease